MHPVYRAGPVTGINFTMGSYEKLQPGFRDEKRLKILPGDEFWRQILETKERWRNTRILTSIASLTLKAVSLQLNAMLMMWKLNYSRQCKTMPSGPPEFTPPVIPVTGMKC